MPDRVIPLHEPDDFNEENALAFTDVIVILYLEGLPRDPNSEDVVYESGPLTEAVIGSFALGCAVGIKYYDKIQSILSQTHPGQVEPIINQCKASLVEQISQVTSGMHVLEPEDFIDELLKALEDSIKIDTETAQNSISMSFEYGLILAYTQKPVAIALRNAFDRSQQEAITEFELDDGDEFPPGPDPYQTLQNLSSEIMEAYEADIGFNE